VKDEMSSEEEFRRLMVELRIFEGTAESLQSRLNLMNTTFIELSYTKKTLEGVEKEEAGVPLLVPIGGGSYAKAKLGDVDKVVYGIGAGVAVERTLKEASEGISSRISQIEKTRRSLEQQLAQVVRRIQEDQTKLQRLSADLRKRERR
jgi:prefoldin alpha subunit